MKTKIGTPYYMAPEVIEGSYNESCDMWSLGVITYTIICGYHPFDASNDNELYKKIKTGIYEFHDPEWEDISEEAKDFISKLLKTDPKQRMTP
jgi:calcium-dependent protein kinase